MRNRIHISRAVHREDILLRHQEVHDREDTLLDLTGIGGAGNQDFLLGIIDKDRCFTVYPVGLRIAVEAGGYNDGKIGFAEIIKLFFRRTNQQLMNEQVLRCIFVDDPELFGADGICTGKAVKDIKVAALQIGAHFGTDRVVFRFGNRTVDLAPCNAVMNLRNINNEFVVR